MFVIKHIDEFSTGGKKDFFTNILKFDFYRKRLGVEQLQNTEIK